jgi:hypothetical protein
MIDASFFLSAEDETIVRVTRQGSEREFSVMPVDNPELTRTHLRAPEPVIPVVPIIPVLKGDE